MAESLSMEHRFSASWWPLNILGLGDTEEGVTIQGTGRVFWGKSGSLEPARGWEGFQAEAEAWRGDRGLSLGDRRAAEGGREGACGCSQASSLGDLGSVEPQEVSEWRESLCLVLQRASYVCGCCRVGDWTGEQSSAEAGASVQGRGTVQLFGRSKRCCGVRRAKVVPSSLAQGTLRTHTEPRSTGLEAPWPTASPAPAHGPAAPRQEGVGGGAAAKEKWVWGGGGGGGCGCVVRGRRSLERSRGRQGPAVGQRGGGKVRGLGPEPHPHRPWCSRLSPPGLQSPRLTLMAHTCVGGLWDLGACGPGLGSCTRATSHSSGKEQRWWPRGPQPLWEGHRHARLCVGTGSPEAEAEVLPGYGWLLGGSFVPAREARR